MSHIDSESMAGESLPYLSANASSAACFEFKESRDGPVQEFKTVRGVILGAWRGNSCWQYKDGPFPGQKVICKANDVKQRAYYSKTLSENQIALLKSMGHTGECGSCGLAQKGAFPGFKPENHIVFLWQRPNAEPIVVLLSFKGWKGFLAAGNFLARFRGRNSTDYIVEWRMEKRSEGDNNYSVPFGSEVGPVGDDMRGEMASLADQYVGAARYRAPAERVAVTAPTTAPALPAAPDADEDFPF